MNVLLKKNRGEYVYPHLLTPFDSGMATTIENFLNITFADPNPLGWGEWDYEDNSFNTRGVSEEEYESLRNNSEVLNIKFVEVNTE